MNFEIIERSLHAFSIKTKQEAVHVLSTLLREQIRIDDFFAYVETLKNGDRRTPSAEISPLYKVVDGKLRKMRKRTPDERAAWKAHLMTIRAGPIRP